MRLYEIDGKLRDKIKNIYYLYVSYSFLVDVDLKKAAVLSEQLVDSINEIYPTVYEDINKDLENWMREANSILFKILGK